MSKIVRLLVLVIALCYFSSGYTQPVNPDALAFPCMACHGPEGNSLGGIPSLNGLSYEQIKDSLRAFKMRQRQGVIMNRIANGYSNEQIEILAHYFAHLKK